jgi:hypothetical protein
MRHEVTDDDTARALGSGEIEVLGTPRLLAWLEGATVEAAKPLLADGQTTVGTGVRIRHRRPTRVGGRIEVTAELRQALLHRQGGGRRRPGRRRRRDRPGGRGRRLRTVSSIRQGMIEST